MSKHDTKKPHEIRPAFLGIGQVYCRTCASMVQESVTRANALLTAPHFDSPALDDEEGDEDNGMTGSSRK